jgi:D-alanyl-D-alanine carboxypeptidase
MKAIVTDMTRFAIKIAPTCLLILFILLFMGILGAKPAFAQTNQTTQPGQSNQSGLTGQTSQVASFSYNPTASKILGKHVLVTNLSTGQVLFDRESSVAQPLASLTKLMTAITVKEIYSVWTNPPERIRLISKTGAYTEADRAVAVGGWMKANDLLSYMLLSSSNFAAQSFAEGIMPYTSFISYMNFTAKRLGINNSHFVNASGLTNDNGTSSTGTASDIMKTLAIIMKKYPELAAATRSEDAVIKSSTGTKVTIDNTNKSLENIPNLALGKTGYTDEAGGNLAVVIKRNGNYYGIVVLGSTLDGRFKDVEYLASLVPANISSSLQLK